MMMAKKFGWVKDYEDWRKPRIVENALELLEKEISSLNLSSPLKLYACGPNSMLYNLAQLLKQFPYIEAFASLEQFMGCGVGACLGHYQRSVGAEKAVHERISSTQIGEDTQALLDLGQKVNILLCQVSALLNNAVHLLLGGEKAPARSCPGRSRMHCCFLDSASQTRGPRAAWAPL